MISRSLPVADNLIDEDEAGHAVSGYRTAGVPMSWNIGPCTMALGGNMTCATEVSPHSQLS